MSDAPITQRDLDAAVAGATLAVQLSELSKDMGNLIGRMDRHEQQHRDDAVDNERRRVSSRRFRITAVIGAMAGFAGVGALLVDVLNRIH